MTRTLFIALSCVLLLSSSIARAQAPGTDFTATPLAGCSPLVVQFTDQSTNGPLFWSWDFGNGLTSNIQNPTATYSAPGTYTVTLIARNKSGANVMRKTDYITVYPSPIPQFTSNYILACVPASIQFTDNSTPGQGTDVAWSWSFGDGGTSTAENPSHAYQAPGYYNVALTVTNSGGCTAGALITRYLRIVDSIQPNFSWSQVSTSCTAPYSLNFINQTAGPGNLTYNWSLGNGAVPATSTAASPGNITYPSNGQYAVTLQVYSSLGCSSSITEILPFNGNSLVLDGPSVVCANSPASFSNASTPSPGASTWSFGDGTAGSDSTNVTHTFLYANTYTVKLVNRNSGCADSTTKPVQVVNPPVPAFTSNVTSSCKAPLTVNFTDNSTGGPITAWSWDFGDGQTATTQNPSHTYNALGAYDVKLTVTGPGNCPQTITQKAYITIQAPTVSINNAGNLGACVASTATNNTLYPTSSANTVDLVSSYSWTAPGSNEGSSTSAYPGFTYNTAGNYTINLTITTSGGCTASTSSPVSIGLPIVPTISPGPTASICGRYRTIFTATNPQGQGWAWTFGDGTRDTVSKDTAGHTYNAIGTYNLILTQTNNGCPQAVQDVVTVNPPIAGFTSGINCGGSRFLVNFTDTSKTVAAFGPISWSWNFGDPASGPNNTSTLQNPTHTFPTTPTAQTYTVTLTVTNGSCTNSTAVPVTVGPIIASFKPPPPASICKNGGYSFTSTSTPYTLIETYTWVVDPGTPGELDYPPSKNSALNVLFTTNGNHQVQLTILDTFHCTQTVTNTIPVTGPIALLAPASGCINAPVTFTDESTPYLGSTSPSLPPVSIASWSFSFGDGHDSTFTAPPFTHTYSDTSSFSVTLSVTDNAGCTDYYILRTPPVHITGPLANFGEPDSFYCPNTALTFIDSSQGYGLTDSWNFGDGNTSPSPTHSYPDGSYNVTLTVTDVNGCKSTKTRSLTIHQPVAAFNIYDTTAICTPLEAIFSSHSQYDDSLYWNFGDGSTSTLDSTSHFYNTTDTFTAKLYVQGPGGCLDSASRRVLVLNPFNTTVFTYSPVKKCDSVPAQFAITPPGFTTFELVFGDNTIDTSGNTAPFHMYRNPNTYSPLLYETDATGCIVPVGGQSGPITVLGSTPFFSPSAHTFCDSGTVAFTDFTISNDGFDSETYSFGDGSAAQTETPGSGSFDPTHFYGTPGTYVPTLTVVTSSNCTETYNDTIRVYQTPHPVITVAGLACTGIIPFQGSLTQPIVDSILWSWNFGNGQTSIHQDTAILLDPGDYTVTLRTAVILGCADTTSTNLTIHPTPLIKGPSVITTPVGVPITIPFVYSGGIATYNWEPQSNLNCTDCPNPAATLTFNAEYTVVVTDTNSCTAIDSIYIKTICNDNNYFLPNTFSPNGDGVNDWFYPRGTSLYNIQSMTVFNRWGQMVFQRKSFPANAETMGWDGTFNGKPAPSDAYVYIVEVICDNAQVVVLHGSVTLLR